MKTLKKIYRNGNFLEFTINKNSQKNFEKNQQSIEGEAYNRASNFGVVKEIRSLECTVFVTLY